MDMCQGEISDGAAFAERYLDWCATLTQHDDDAMVTASVVGPDGVLGDVDVIAACALATAAAGGSAFGKEVPEFVRAVAKGRNGCATAAHILNAAGFRNAKCCTLVCGRKIYGINDKGCEEITHGETQSHPAW
jgi:hypothetical protein